MEVLEKVKLINPTQEVSASFKKRELVVTTDEQYPQHILIEFAQDKCDILDNYQVGQNVKVSINLRGREWVNQQESNEIQNASYVPEAKVVNSKEEEQDDLPI